MSKVLKSVLAGVLVIIFVVSIGYLVTLHNVASDPAWPKNIQRRTNALGMINIYDAESGTSLFWHHNDSAAYPVKVEKQDENHWIVVFEKRK